MTVTLYVRTALPLDYLTDSRYRWRTVSLHGDGDRLDYIEKTVMIHL